MSYLNTPTPIVEAFIRGNFLRNQEDSFDKKFPCYIFGMSSIPAQAPLFHFSREDGGIWWRMPIHAFCWKEDAPQQGDFINQAGLDHNLNIFYSNGGSGKINRYILGSSSELKSN